MFERKMDNNILPRKRITYTSCIKINGVPILPPLITLERRKELSKYKKQAIKLEQRLKNCRELKKNLDKLLTHRTISMESPDITFIGNSHIEALGICDILKNSRIDKPRKVSLSKDIVDISQYSNDGIKVLHNEFDQNQNSVDNLNSSGETMNDVESIEVSLVENLKNIVLDSKSQQCPVLDLTNTDEKTVDDQLSDVESTPKPRLIRSNSYTLEAPSPILLANINKVGPISSENVTEYSDTQNCTFDENNHFESSDFSSINTVLNQNKPDSSTGSPKKDIRIKSPTIEVFQTDISVQQVTVNTVDKNNEVTLTTLDLDDPDSDLMQVLKSIPVDYSNQIIEIIKHQKAEQQQRLHRYDNIAEATVNNAQINLENVSLPDKGQPVVDRLRRSSTFSMSPSQSVYYSLNNSSPDTVTPTPSISVKLGELDSECDKSEKSISNVEKLSNYWEGRINDDRYSVNRELFAKNNDEVLKIQKMNWAASVIGAHAKGYLTRRLLRTERVQALIDTIRDALMCALELHNSDTIDEADVELHRRLLQQVSAACFAFHDIFFALPVHEQMQIISIDRQHKIEKAKRPLSATSSRRSLNSSRSSKSLVPSSRSLTNVLTK